MAQSMSYPIDTIDGQEFYRYKVQKGEGLYRISQKFGVSQEDIVRYNRVLETSGLKIDQIIHLPITAANLDSTQYIIHIIQAKETLYGLSKQYGVTVEQLQKLNPQTSKNMPIGARLIVKRKSAGDQVATQQLKQHIEVNPEQLLAKQQEQTTAAKPVQSRTDTLRTIIKETIIADKAEPAPEDNTPEVPQTDIALVAPADTVADEEAPALPMRIAFLVPFCADAAERDASMDKFLTFYEGALLAIRQLQAQGQHFELFVFDVGKSELKMGQVLKKPELTTVDAIIGPAYPAQVALAAVFAKAERIPTFFPFTNKVPDIKENPYIFQLNPTTEEGKKAIIARKSGEGWTTFDNDFRNYFGSNNYASQSPRYDMLGYDLTTYVVRSLQALVSAQDEEDRQNIFETAHDGLQTYIHFLRTADFGGYMNEAMEVVDRE